MKFKYTENTKVTIDGEEMLIRFENGMTGIGSRTYWINDVQQSKRAVFHTEDVEKGNHLIYKIKWRDDPYSYVDVIIHEDFENELLTDENKWREPIKRQFPLEKV